MRLKSERQHGYLIWLSVLLALVGLICLWMARSYAADAGAVITQSGSYRLGYMREEAGWDLARKLAIESNSGAASGFAVAGGLSLLAAAVAAFGAARVADLSRIAEQTARVSELEALLREAEAASFGLRDEGAAEKGDEGATG